jgi:hypothetical protein
MQETTRLLEVLRAERNSPAGAALVRLLELKLEEHMEAMVWMVSSELTLAQGRAQAISTLLNNITKPALKERLAAAELKLNVEGFMS